MDEGHCAAIRWLERRQAFHRLYLQGGIAVSMACIFVAEVVALTLDNHGWHRAAFGAMKLFELSLIVSTLGPLLFFLNLLLLGNWHCPKCDHRPEGWVAKGEFCLDCGLKFHIR